MLGGGVVSLLVGLLGIGLLPLGSGFFSIPNLPKCDNKILANIQQIWDTNGKTVNTTQTAADKWTMVMEMTEGFVPKIIDCLLCVLHPEQGNASTGFAQIALFGHRLSFFNLTFTITEKDGTLYVRETKSMITNVFYENGVFLLYCCNEAENAKPGKPVYQIDVSKGYDQKSLQKAWAFSRQLGAPPFYGYGKKCEKYLNNDKEDGNHEDTNLVEGAETFIKNLLGFK